MTADKLLSSIWQSSISPNCFNIVNMEHWSLHNLTETLLSAPRCAHISFGCCNFSVIVSLIFEPADTYFTRGASHITQTCHKKPRFMRWWTGLQSTGHLLHYSGKSRLTAKCGSRSTRSSSVKAEISRALGRWSTTAWSGTPLPRPRAPLPRALGAPRPRADPPRPRPGVSSPLLAAWTKKKAQTKGHFGGIRSMTLYVNVSFKIRACAWVHE